MFIPLNVSIVFYADTHIRTVFKNILQGLFNYLSPRELFPSAWTALQHFLLFGNNIIFFPALNGYILKNSFSLSFANLYLPENLFKIFLVYKVRFYGGPEAVLQYLFIFFSAGLDSRAKVWYRTRNTPVRLGFAAALKILNHTSLGVDVPVFLNPGDVTSFSYFFS